jgi:glutaminyl-tRNA synthetase
VLYIERGDFREDPPKKFQRLAPGREVRLKRAYLITCEDVVKDENGEIVELRVRYDPETKGGVTPDGRYVRTLHWVSAEHALDVEVRLYDRLFTKADMNDIPEGEHFTDYLNPDSLEVTTAKAEPSLADAEPGDRFQFYRKSYVCLDPDSTEERLIFNRTVPLRSTWAKIAERLKKS